MSINDLKEKIKPFYTPVMLCIIALIFFGLGRLSVLEERQKPIKIIYPNAGQTSAVALSESYSIPVPAVSNPTSEEVVGSKSGKKYYYPWCGTAKRMKPENTVRFASIQEARDAGFTPGGNCKGLK
jgi:hypothetical protein